MTNGTGFLFAAIAKLIIATNSLSVVLNYKQVVLAGNCHNLFHRSSLSV